MTTAFIVFALVSFFQKSVRLKYITLVVDRRLHGRHQEHADFGHRHLPVVDFDFPTFKYSVTWYMFAGFTVVSTVLWGRLYCGRICAFGAFTQLMDATVPKRFRMEPPAWLERRAGFVKYGLLVAVVVYYIATRAHRHLPLRRAVLDVHAVGEAVLWSMLVRCSSRPWSCAICTAASSARLARCSD